MPRKVGMRSCKEMREASMVCWWFKDVSAPDLATLGTLGSVLPALQILTLATTTQAQPAPRACSGWRRG